MTTNLCLLQGQQEQHGQNMMHSIIPTMITSNKITITIPNRAPTQGGKLETSSKTPLAKKEHDTPMHDISTLAH